MLLPLRGVATPGHGEGEGSAVDKFRVSGTQETVEGAGANEVSGVLSEASCCRCGAPLIKKTRPTLFSRPLLQMPQKKLGPVIRRDLIFFAAFGDWICTYRRAANTLNSFVSANVAQIKRLQVVNFVVFCVVLANFLKNPCHNIILKAQDHTRSRPRDGSAAACAQ